VHSISPRQSAIQIMNGYKQTKLGRIPIEWEVRRLGRLIFTFSGGTPDRGKTHFYVNDSDGVPWIKSGELNLGTITATEEFISEDALNQSSAKLVEPGTLLYALYGATAGVVAFTKIRAAINQAVLAIIPNEKLLLPEFLAIYLTMHKML
jgi:type I restriction enzyme S subunit